MGRIERKKLGTERLKLKCSDSEGTPRHVSMFDVFDDAVKETYCIDDEEYDFLALHASDEELDDIMAEMQIKASYTKAKRALEVIDKYVELYKKSLHE